MHYNSGMQSVKKPANTLDLYNADLADDFPDELAQFMNFSRVALTDPTTQ